MKSDIELYDILTQAKRNIIWAEQEKIDITTRMHLGTSQHLIEIVQACLKERFTAKPSK
ncbi:hypothetical protein [Desulfuromonas sp. TF]|uniref:hypothetical protein n=1 Tax=Desulfuromonas sp. TF TaxID=1232410 RepID=UPI000404452E|nr:hypothetical protein [Desulfuromonas sp. TF]